MTKPIDLTGKRFGRLTALRPTELRSGNCIVWECLCDCGNISYASTENLRKGHTASCGCVHKEIIRSKVSQAGLKANSKNYTDGTCIPTLMQDKRANNTSGTVGVRWHKAQRKWIADIQFKGKRYYLCSTADKEFAIKVRKEAEQRIHGEFLDWYYSEHPERKQKGSPPD